MLLVATIAQAEEPAWWEARGVLSAQSPSNYSPANIGQAKWIADNAWDEFATRFGGSPSGFKHSPPFLKEDLFPHPPQPSGGAQNYAVLNAGQLKHLAERFYDYLWGEIPGYMPDLFEAMGLGPSWPHPYPWDPTTPTDDNYFPANIGQLKTAFRFTFDIDADSDDLADWWEWYHFTDLAQDATGDWDGDGLLNGQEEDAGTSPTDGDTDGDGVSDPDEIASGTDPDDPASFSPRWLTITRSAAYDYDDYEGGTKSIAYTAGWDRSLDFSEELSIKIRFPDISGRLETSLPFPPSPEGIDTDGAMPRAFTGFGWIDTSPPGPCYHAGLAHERVWLQRGDSESGEQFTAQAVRITERHINDVPQPWVTDTVTVTLAAEQTLSQPIDLIATFTTNPTLEDESEWVKEHLLPIEMKVVDRDDPMRKWGEEKDHNSTKPIYAGEADSMS